MLRNKKLNDNIQVSFDNVAHDIRDLVVDNARLRHRIKTLEDAVSGYRGFIDGFAESEKTIKKLEKEVFESKKDSKSSIYLASSLLRHTYDFPAYQEPTLAGKVDAIIEHLGIEVDVKPEEVIKAKAVAKKKPAPKKKGRK